MVNKQGISKNLFEKELSYYQKFYLKKYGDDFLDTKSKEGDSNYKKLESNLLDSMIKDQIMLEDLKKHNIKVTKNDSINLSNELIRSISSKESLYANIASFGSDEKEFSEIIYRDSIRKKHREYFINNNKIKDLDVIKYFDDNKYLQKKVKYDCLIFDDKSEAVKTLSKIKDPQDFKSYLKAKIRNYDIYRSDFVYEDNNLLKSSSLSKSGDISKVFKYKDSYIILMINSVNTNKKDLLLNAKEIYIDKEYNKYLENLVKNSNIKLFI